MVDLITDLSWEIKEAHRRVLDQAKRFSSPPPNSAHSLGHVGIEGFLWPRKKGSSNKVELIPVRRIITPPNSIRPSWSDV
jgi:hypothetical protein